MVLAISEQRKLEARNEHMDCMGHFGRGISGFGDRRVAVHFPPAERTPRTDAILDAAERDGEIIEAAKDPRAAAKLAALRRGNR